MTGPITRPLETETGAHPSYPRAYSKSMGEGATDEAIDGNHGNITKIVLDLGKSINAVALCAAFCGLCAAVTIGTVWHHKERETETQARIRVLQNHIDENTAQLRVMEKSHAPDR